MFSFISIFPIGTVPEPGFKLAVRQAILSEKRTRAIWYLQRAKLTSAVVQLHAREALVVENEETIAINALADSELVLVITSMP